MSTSSAFLCQNVRLFHEAMYPSQSRPILSLGPLELLSLLSWLLHVPSYSPGDRGSRSEESFCASNASKARVTCERYWKISDVCLSTMSNKLRVMQPGFSNIKSSASNDHEVWNSKVTYNECIHVNICSHICHKPMHIFQLFSIDRQSETS